MTNPTCYTLNGYLVEIDKNGDMILTNDERLSFYLEGDDLEKLITFRNNHPLGGAKSE